MKRQIVVSALMALSAHVALAEQERQFSGFGPTHIQALQAAREAATAPAVRNSFGPPNEIRSESCQQKTAVAWKCTIDVVYQRAHSSFWFPYSATGTDSRAARDAAKEHAQAPAVKNSFGPPFSMNIAVATPRAPADFTFVM